MHNPVVHVEVLGRDAGVLQNFYSEAFGWEFAPQSPHALGEMDYRIAFPNGDIGVPAGVGGAHAEVSEQGIIFYVCVDNLSEALLNVQRLGGKVVRGPAHAPTGGVRIALIEDPEGHVIGLVDKTSLPQ